MVDLTSSNYVFGDWGTPYYVVDVAFDKNLNLSPLHLQDVEGTRDNNVLICKLNGIPQFVSDLTPGYFYSFLNYFLTKTDDGNYMCHVVVRGDSSTSDEHIYTALLLTTTEEVPLWEVESQFSQTSEVNISNALVTPFNLQTSVEDAVEYFNDDGVFITDYEGNYYNLYQDEFHKEGTREHYMIIETDNATFSISPTDDPNAIFISDNRGFRLLQTLKEHAGFMRYTFRSGITYDNATHTITLNNGGASTRDNPYNPNHNLPIFKLEIVCDADLERITSVNIDWIPVANNSEINHTYALPSEISSNKIRGFGGNTSVLLSDAKYYNGLELPNGIIVLNGIVFIYDREEIPDNIDLGNDNIIEARFAQLYIDGIRTPFRRYNPETDTWERLDNFLGEE